MFKLITSIVLFVMPVVGLTNTCNEFFSDQQLLTIKGHNFIITAADERNETALALLNCLGHPDPKIRDGLVYEASSFWLREKLLTTETIKTMFVRLLHKLELTRSADIDGFTKPFAALVLSEIVRVDRITPYLSDEQRQQLVDVTTTYMQNISDYRGFNDKDGWRHAVAHTADVFLQLALNKKINKAQLTQLLNAIKYQTTPVNSHFYIYGEPKRLAMPFVYIALRAEYSEQELISYLDKIVNPAPFPSWDSVYASNSGLAKLHNTRAFMYSIYAITSKSKNPKLQGIQAKLAEIINQLG